MKIQTGDIVLTVYKKSIKQLTAERDQLQIKVAEQAVVIEMLFRTVKENQEWHNLYNPYEGYIYSDLAGTNSMAIRIQPSQALADYRDEVLEEAAVKCDALANCEENTNGYRHGASWCAEAIRAMKASYAPAR